MDVQRSRRAADDGTIEEEMSAIPTGSKSFYRRGGILKRFMKNSEGVKEKLVLSTQTKMKEACNVQDVSKMERSNIPVKVTRRLKNALESNEDTEKTSGGAVHSKLSAVASEETQHVQGGRVECVASMQQLRQTRALRLTLNGSVQIVKHVESGDQEPVEEELVYNTRTERKKASNFRDVSKTRSNIPVKVTRRLKNALESNSDTGGTSEGYVHSQKMSRVKLSAVASEETKDVQGRSTANLQYRQTRWNLRLTHNGSLQIKKNLERCVQEPGEEKLVHDTQIVRKEASNFEDVSKTTRINVPVNVTKRLNNAEEINSDTEGTSEGYVPSKTRRHVKQAAVASEETNDVQVGRVQSTVSMQYRQTRWNLRLAGTESVQNAKDFEGGVQKPGKGKLVYNTRTERKKASNFEDTSKAKQSNIPMKVTRRLKNTEERNGNTEGTKGASVPSKGVKLSAVASEETKDVHGGRTASLQYRQTRWNSRLTRNESVQTAKHLERGDQEPVEEKLVYNTQTERNKASNYEDVSKIQSNIPVKVTRRMKNALESNGDSEKSSGGSDPSKKTRCVKLSAVTSEDTQDGKGGRVECVTSMQLGQTRNLRLTGTESVQIAKVLERGDQEPGEEKLVYNPQTERKEASKFEGVGKTNRSNIPMKVTRRLKIAEESDSDTEGTSGGYSPSKGVKLSAVARTNKRKSIWIAAAVTENVEIGKGSLQSVSNMTSKKTRHGRLASVEWNTSKNEDDVESARKQRASNEDEREPVQYLEPELRVNASDKFNPSDTKTASALLDVQHEKEIPTEGSAERRKFRHHYEVQLPRDMVGVEEGHPMSNKMETTSHAVLNRGRGETTTTSLSVPDIDERLLKPIMMMPSILETSEESPSRQGIHPEMSFNAEEQFQVAGSVVDDRLLKSILMMPSILETTEESTPRQGVHPEMSFIAEEQFQGSHVNERLLKSVMMMPSILETSEESPLRQSILPETSFIAEEQFQGSDVYERLLKSIITMPSIPETSEESPRQGILPEMSFTAEEQFQGARPGWCEVLDDTTSNPLEEYNRPAILVDTSFNLSSVELPAGWNRHLNDSELPTFNRSAILVDTSTS